MTAIVASMPLGRGLADPDPEELADDLRSAHRRHVVDVACRVQLDDVSADDDRIARPDLAERVEQLPGRQPARLVV